MVRVTLLHWNRSEGEERAALLRACGCAVDLVSEVRPEELRAMGAHPPDAFVIDLNRLPSHGREVAGVLRRQKATRTVPLVFVEGDPAKTTRVRGLFPDAVYASWENIGAALEQARTAAPANPAVPGVMAGYSGTPLPRKLGIKAGVVVALLGAPKGFEKALDPLPEKVQIRKTAGARADLILLFVRTESDLKSRFPPASKVLAARGAIWIVWPKKASGVATDLAQQFIREFGLAAGFVDYKICAVDATWSGLLFTRRRF